MHLQKLFFRNFRNFEKVELNMEKGFHLFWGDNAQGKTNFIEAVFVLANLKSFRNSKNADLIQWGKKSCRISGEILFQSSIKKVELEIGKKGKLARVNGKPVKSGRDYFGSFKTVLFSPEELNLVKGGPAGRRALLDRAVFLADPDYLNCVKKYENFLKNRNQLLKERRDRVELDVWTEGFLKAGVSLRKSRITYLREFIPQLKKNYEEITGGREKIDIVYPGSQESGDELETNFREDLIKTREREDRFGYTLAGPHWDDPIFLLNDRPLRDFGSQGQKRSFLMAFKITQIQDVEAKTGRMPVLLLDDMASELDFLRQVNFFRFLSAREGQVFITTTDKQQLSRCGVTPVRSYQVSGGTLEEEKCERL
jgi:DNA replication and repair protein RecF